MKLLIKETGWSGLILGKRIGEGVVVNYKCEEIEKEYEIVLNKKYVIQKRKYENSEGEYEKEILSFDITEINENSIRIRTYQGFHIDTGEKGIDLHANNTNFTILKDLPLKLCTPTMDSGDIFIFTLTD